MAGLLDGVHDVPLIPFNVAQAGVDLGNAIVLPPGGNVFYVRGNGTSITEYDYDPPGLRERLNASINVALGQCVASRGDVVAVLPGHTENITGDDGWSNIKANVAIIGFGRGTARPTITWTAATSNLDIDVANVRIQNLILNMAGSRSSTTALTVTNGVAVTAAGFELVNCEVNLAVDADQLCTDAFTLSATADDCAFVGNFIFGSSSGEITSVVTTTGAVDRLKFLGNTMACAVATAATGVLLDLDNAAIGDNLILNNILYNRTVNSKFVVDPHATSAGVVHGNLMCVNDSGTGPASLGFATYTTGYRFGVNYCVTADSASAILSPAADS